VGIRGGWDWFSSYIEFTAGMASVFKKEKMAANLRIYQSQVRSSSSIRYIQTNLGTKMKGEHEEGTFFSGQHEEGT
jgi:hypothetical protein